MAYKRPPNHAMRSEKRFPAVDQSDDEVARSSRPLGLLKVETRPASVASTSTAISSTTSQKSAKSQGTNIKVVVRCRGPTHIEISQKTPIIVSTDSLKSQELAITDVPYRSSGAEDHAGVTLKEKPHKRYQFDQVFGPEAEQSIIYQDVVVPLLNEVFDGYNCTIFAYGQTGTGKTYTMHGELDAQANGALSQHAGIVPRVITRLFQRLEQDYSDYAVSMSCMEIYNEEIHDLLTYQPAQKGLKVFEEPSKKGTIVQGLHEVLVKDVKTAIDIVRQGISHRHVAATNFNANSSRSHSIFTISVIANSPQSEVFQIGKLNLVDLAGSEDIGRSGVDGLHAKEAGSINKSLLTLGRVINALVERSERTNYHIPYRESLLTRILQDSLGGRTKTCVIATISPARTNQEETVSTLDYAIRARNIKNNPEMTRRLAKDALLKDLVSEMDKLRVELIATREKNGRYIPEASWDKMQVERELLRKEHAESKRTCELLNANFKTLQEEYDYGLLRLKRGEDTWTQTKVELKEALTSLQDMEDTLAHTRLHLNKEKSAREDLEKNSAKLDRAVSSFRQLSKQSTSDIDELFDKLDRKAKILDSNAAEVIGQERNITNALQSLGNSLRKHLDKQTSCQQTLVAQIRNHHTSQLNAIEQGSFLARQHVETMHRGLDDVLDREEAASSLCEALAKHVHDTSKLIGDDFSSWRTGLITSLSNSANLLSTALTTQSEDLHQCIKQIGIAHNTVLHHVAEYLISQRPSIRSLQDVVEATCMTEIKRLKAQNENLVALVATDRAAAETMRSEMLDQLNKVWYKHNLIRETAILEVTTKIGAELADRQRGFEDLKLSHNSVVEGILAGSDEVKTRIDYGLLNSQEAVAEALAVLNPLAASAGGGLLQLEGVVSGALTDYEGSVVERATHLSQFSQPGFHRLQKAAQARSETVGTLKAHVNDVADSLDDVFTLTSDAVQGVLKDALTATESANASTQAYHELTNNQISSMGRFAQSLRSQAILEDVPTGTTPRKRKWNFPDSDDHYPGEDGVIRPSDIPDHLADSNVTADEPIRQHIDAGPSLESHNPKSKSALEPSYHHLPALGYRDYEVPITGEATEEARPANPSAEANQGYSPSEERSSITKDSTTNIQAQHRVSPSQLLATNALGTKRAKVAPSKSSKQISAQSRSVIDSSLKGPTKPGSVGGLSLRVLRNGKGGNVNKTGIARQDGGRRRGTVSSGMDS